jgi:hypothetical protein
MVLVFDRASGNYAFRFPEGLTGRAEEFLYRFAVENGGLKKPQNEYVFADVSLSDVRALLTGLYTNDHELNLPWDLLQYSDGAVVMKSAEAAALQARNARRTAVRTSKQAVKASKKLEGFENMTQKDWNDLTAAQKWDMVFAFMKSHLSED